MKLRYLSLSAIILLIPVCVWARGLMVVGGGVPSEAPSYLYRERAEGGSQTWGGDSDNEILMSVTKGSADANEQGTVLEGSESIELIDGGATECRFQTPVLTTGDGDIYFAYIVVTPEGEGEDWYPNSILTAGGDCIASWYLAWNGGQSKWTVRVYWDDDDDGTCNAVTAASGVLFTASTTYYFRLMVNNGSKIGFAYSASPFSSWTDVANGGVISGDVEDSQPQIIRWSNVDDSPTFVDDIRIDDADITY